MNNVSSPLSQSDYVMKQEDLSSQLNIKTILPILNKISIFGGLSTQQLSAVVALLQRAYYQAGEYIFKQGSEPSHIYIIRSGSVKIVAERDVTFLELIVFGVGDCFGETSIISIEPHSASAIAIEDTEVMILSRKALFSIFEQDKELFGLLLLNIAREACRRLHTTNETLLHYFSKQ